MEVYNLVSSYSIASSEISFDCNSKSVSSDTFSVALHLSIGIALQSSGSSTIVLTTEQAQLCNSVL